MSVKKDMSSLDASSNTRLDDEPSFISPLDGTDLSVKKNFRFRHDTDKKLSGINKEE